MELELEVDELEMEWMGKLELLLACRGIETHFLSIKAFPRWRAIAMDG